MLKFFRSYSLFILMFSITLLLNINFTILRSVRNTLTVVDLGSGAGSIPIFELCAALPLSILMTWFLSKLMNRIPMRKIFFITIFLFLSFFLIFTFGLYPKLEHLRHQGVFGSAILHLSSMVFYGVCELWKPALIVILFWGLVNQHMPLTDAKKLYAPLMLGGSIGAIFSGPLISFCTSTSLWKFLNLFGEQWTHALTMMMLMITVLGIITAFLYHRLCHHFAKAPLPSNPQKISLKESISLCMKVKEFRLLGWIVIADYIAYSLGEVIFLDVLKTRFPKACDYCNYMGLISSWAGILTIISALFIAPFILKRSQWVVAAIATPICLLITEGAFFMFLRGRVISNTWFGWSEIQWVNVIVLLGSIQYCMCRATKYTLFDSSKELAYVLMPSFQKMQGKLVIDGLCARLGRGSASTISLCMISLCGGVFASSVFTGIIALGMGFSWLLTTLKLGSLFQKNETQNLSRNDIN